MTTSTQLDLEQVTAKQQIIHAYKRLVKAVGRKEATRLRRLWDEDRPHFGGGAPHRYDDQTACVYCFRPINYRPLDK